MSASSSVPTHSRDEGTPSYRSGETIAESMLLLLAATLVQRLVGLARSVLFCRWLTEDQLGQWDLVFGFLCFAAPCAVFGIPGSFARYVGFYRQRGQERRFRVWSVLVCAALTATAGLVLWWGEEFFSWFIFQRAGQAQAVRLTAVTLMTVIAFNFLVEWYGGMRMFRVVAVLHFLNSLLFACLGVTLLWTWSQSALAVTLSYALACVASSVGVVLLARGRRQDPPPSAAAAEPLPVWSKVMPFAIWMWVTNLVSNLLDLVDRYLLVHWSGLEAEQALGLVGQYHSSRVVPLLLISLAGIVERAMTPHLSLEWETGHRRRVGTTLNLVVKLSGLGLWLGGLAILVGSPLLFDVAFAGKYNEGLHVLPWTITYCVWFGMATIGMNYLWCSEQSRLASYAFALGLAANVLLNALLIPRFGLHGAVLGTAAGNLVTLMAVSQFGRWLGWKMDGALYLVHALPLVFPLGTAPALAVALLVAVGAVRSNLILRRAERRKIAAWCRARFGRVEVLLKRMRLVRA